MVSSIHDTTPLDNLIYRRRRKQLGEKAQPDYSNDDENDLLVSENNEEMELEEM